MNIRGLRNIKRSRQGRTMMHRVHHIVDESPPPALQEYEKQATNNNKLRQPIIHH